MPQLPVYYICNIHLHKSENKSIKVFKVQKIIIIQSDHYYSFTVGKILQGPSRQFLLLLWFAGYMQMQKHFPLGHDLQDFSRYCFLSCLSAFLWFHFYLAKRSFCSWNYIPTRPLFNTHEIRRTFLHSFIWTPGEDEGGEGKHDCTPAAVQLYSEHSKQCRHTVSFLFVSLLYRSLTNFRCNNDFRNIFWILTALFHTPNLHRTHRQCVMAEHECTYVHTSTTRTLTSCAEPRLVVN